MKTKKRCLACVLSFGLLMGLIPATEAFAAKAVRLSTKKLTLTKGASKTITVKNTKKKVQWKILSGSKNINLKKKKNSAVITGKKTGTAKVQAALENKKLTCKVTVKDAGKAASKPTATPLGNVNTPAQVNPFVSQRPVMSSMPHTTKTPSMPDVTKAPSASDEKIEKDKQDVAALKALITEQRERGATVSEDLDSGEYTWENGKLTEINWDDKSLSGSLDISGCVNLTSLSCKVSDLFGDDESRNQLDSLNVSKNINLKQLNCGGNKLSSVDVNKNVNLAYLNCEYNQLSSLDVSKNVKLRQLWCSGNELSTLDLTNNTILTDLQCDDTVTVIGYNK